MLCTIEMKLYITKKYRFSISCDMLLGINCNFDHKIILTCQKLLL